MSIQEFIEGLPIADYDLYREINEPAVIQFSQLDEYHCSYSIDGADNGLVQITQRFLEEFYTELEVIDFHLCFKRAPSLKIYIIGKDVKRRSVFGWIANSEVMS